MPLNRYRDRAVYDKGEVAIARRASLGLFSYAEFAEDVVEHFFVDVFLGDC